MVVDELSDERADALFHALAHSVRRDILRRCGSAELSVSRLAAMYAISFAAVQRHVAVLEQAGLIVKRRDGREQLAHTDTDAVTRAHRELDRLALAWHGRASRMGATLAAGPRGAP